MKTNKTLWIAGAALSVCGSSFAASDTVGLTGTIAQVVTIDIANSSTSVTMTNNTTTSENMSVDANVPFTITVATEDNELTMANGAGDEVTYAFSVKDASSNEILASLGSANHNEVDATWTYNVTPSGIDGSTDAGTYTDTVTVTVAAQ